MSWQPLASPLKKAGAATALVSDVTCWLCDELIDAHLIHWIKLKWIILNDANNMGNNK